MTRSLALIVALVPAVAAAQSDPAGAPAADPVPAPAPAAAPDSPPAPDATPAFTWEPFGFLRLQYIVVQNDPNVAFVGRDDGFELQNARAGFRGKLAERASFVLSIDGAVDERAQQNTPQGKLRVGLRDAYGDVIAGKLVVRGGYFETWVDPQALVADTSREYVDKPLESRGMRSTEGWYTPGLPPGRSLGAALLLEPAEANQIGFEVAVQNGSDEFSSNNDNDKPAVSASAMFRLADDGFVVASGRWNPRTVGELPFRQDETDLQGSIGAQLNVGLASFGAGAIVQRTTFESTNGPVQNAYGAHAQFMVTAPAKVPLGFGYRFGILDPSSLILTDRVMEHTVGSVISVPSYRMRVQLQITHVMEQGARDLSNSRAQAAVELQL
ncbi:MAG TPA: hypothetical protein VMZ53_27075 [Kofleriaceae bacterium]|nr:hypothetical protein [Kofleriaceae bacterium]